MGKNKSTAIGFIGTPTDIQVAEYIFNYLVREIGRITDEHKETLDDYEGNKWSYLNTYRLGLVRGINRELIKKERASRKAQTSDGHALVEVKKAMIKRHMEESKLHITGQSSKFNPNPDSYEQGLKDGADIVINKGDNFSDTLNGSPLNLEELRELISDNNALDRLAVELYSQNINLYFIVL